MFVHISDPTASDKDLVEFEFEGVPHRDRRGISVAAALLVLGASDVRTTVVSGAARGPFCLMGTCFECLVEINGQPNVQSCMTPLEAGMQIRKQIGRRKIEVTK